MCMYNQVLRMRKETMLRLLVPLVRTFSLRISTDTLPSPFSSNYLIAIFVKYYCSSASSRSNNFSRLLPIIRDIWWRVR